MSAAGLALNLLGFALLFHRLPPPAVAVCLIPLSMLAAGLEIWVSTLCRGVKEAHTYLSMLVFLPMLVGMFMVFSPVAGHGWWKFLPVAGQQTLLDAGMRGAQLDLPAVLFLLTIFVVEYARQRNRAHLLGAAAMVVSLIAAICQQAKLAIDAVGLSHNALYHVVQGAGLGLLFMSASRLTRVPPEHSNNR